MMKELTDETFQEMISTSELPVLVDFWAPWCGPCKLLAPVLDEIAQEMEGKLVVAKLQIEENPITPSQFGVRSIPTLILFAKGKAVDSKMALQSKEALIKWIQSCL
ncbi:MAG: thioredoxin [Alphaproteobacteria bacterium]